AYPQRVTKDNRTALTMMLFGMINWTFTWLKPRGRMSYAEFADEVVRTLERGFE
ncbi:MAG: TetR/AcrR family transcriptional regulator, partial [Betaproteobacteria bacterium]|nr:TetR/AcrR family transcriptional regulator [Betaproteobacteria bacterium]